MIAHRRDILGFILFLSLLALPAAAVTHTVTQVGFTFDPEVLTIEVGDTVEWVWTSGTHTVTNGVDLADPDLGALFDDPLTSADPLASFTFNEVGEVPYICRIHVGLGMTGVIRVTSGVTHTVDQVNLTFVPDEIDINVGDTVEWVWSSGTHTVTNGADLADPDLGTLFDAPLDGANTTFSHTFFETGDVPYLCRPHFVLDMVGVVHVGGPTPVEDAAIPAAFALDQNAPNPFNPRTVIHYTLPASSPVSLRVYDLGGRLVRTLVDESTLAAGRYQVAWNGRDDSGHLQAAGVYVYRLQTASSRTARTMTLLK